MVGVVKADNLQDQRADLLEILKKYHSVCFFTGAGISTDSGIPDFRSPGGIWSQYRIIELQEFMRSKQARIEDWTRRFHMADAFAAAKPNASHQFIAKMITNKRSLGVVTQNIDGLHQRAGVADEHVVEFHGTGAYAHCLTCAQRYEIDDMREYIQRQGEPFDCTCGGLIKAAVVSFGETVPSSVIERALRMIDSCDCLVAIGSSLQVQPASSLLARAKNNGAYLVIINQEPTSFDALADLVINGNAAEITDKIGDFLTI